MILSLIAAFAEDDKGRRVIGLKNGIPWNFPHDLERFKEYTRGCPVVMGRKTHESIGRILPGRDNIVVTAQRDFLCPGGSIFHDLESALDYSATLGSEVFVIGGQQLYEATIERASRLYLTSFRIKGISGDTYFPDWDKGKFKVIHQESTDISGDSFRILERKVCSSEYTGSSVLLNTSPFQHEGAENNPCILSQIYGMYT